MSDPLQAEPLPGLDVLREVPGERGLLLWLMLRDTLLWAATPPERRPRLFAPDAHRHRAMAVRNAGIGGVGARVRALATCILPPGADDPAAAASSARQIAEWATEEGLPETALAYAIAAAALTPEDPRRALQVGTLAASFDHVELAGAWLRRTVGLARRARDGTSYADALVKLGALSLRAAAGIRQRVQDIESRIAALQGAEGGAEPGQTADLQGQRDSLRASMGRKHDLARRYLMKALRAARRHGLTGTRGDAYHVLLRVELAAGNHDVAGRYAERAEKAYGGDHPALPGVWQDVAELLLAQGHAGRAVTTLKRVLPSRTTHADRLRTLALLFRAATAAQDAAEQQGAWFEALASIEHLGETAGAAHALVDLARVAAELGLGTQTAQAAQRALEVARRAGAASAVAEAQLVLRHAAPAR